MPGPSQRRWIGFMRHVHTACTSDLTHRPGGQSIGLGTALSTVGCNSGWAS
ncbi:hypothetical protein FOPG_19116 [Fusarium oxysporum f. sp. conglutinans race 2 54008]|uniref:Uncharacterized protein n=1 Tax=Fusarium oxysporum f. sp. conglutinans race 2 54008 TaxID=1089457 RepID=X0GLW4_FUSOX|nr:hypothetical protein FOPG_19116 [Fusarium oxysporum f. sp. conglutinans race 2 54008]